MIKQITVLFFVVLLATPAFALEIFYPADGTYVVHSDFLIVKAGDDVDGLTLTIGGEKSDLLDISSADYKASFGDFLIVQPNWDKGKNTVEVEAYKGGKMVAGKKAEFYYQSDQTEPPPKGYKRFVMHKTEQEAFCAGCHNMNPSAADLEKVGADNPCASCHKRILEHKNVHGPAGAWQCTYCHDTKSTPVRYLPRKVNAPLCNECHQDLVKTFNKSKFVHGPVAVGLCNVCHDSHASDYPAQILAKTNTLCLECHEGIDKGVHVGSGFSGQPHPLSGVPDPSRPRELSCTGCHNPHSGNVEYFFQGGVTVRLMLCQRCHKK